MIAAAVTLALFVALVVGAVGLATQALRNGRASFSIDALLALSLSVVSWRVRGGLLEPRHVMYVDEPWTLEAATSLVQRGVLELCERTSLIDASMQCVPFPKAPGWPVAVAAAFLVGGGTQATAFAFTSLVSAAAIGLAALLVRACGGDRFQATAASVLLAVHPLHALWSSTTETNAPVTAPLLAGMVGLVLFVRTSTGAAALLAGGGLGLAAWTRPELAVVPVIGLVAVFARAGSREQWPAAWPLAVAGLAGAGAVAWTWALYESNSGGSRFLFLSAIVPNLVKVATDPLGGALTVAVLVLPMVAAVRHRRSAEGASILVASVSASGVLLAAIAYDPSIFYERTVLGAVAVAIPLSTRAWPVGRSPRGWAVSGVVGLVACLGAGFIARPGVEIARRVPGTQRMEMRLPTLVADARTSLTPDTVLVAEWPTVIAPSAERPVLRASRLLEALDERPESLQAAPVLLLVDQFCEPAFMGAPPSACRRVLERFAAEPVRVIEEGPRRYGLVRLRSSAAGTPMASEQFPCAPGGCDRRGGR